MRLLDYLLSDFKWYRKRAGGDWYYVSDPSMSGFSSDTVGWVRESKGMRVEKEEHYSLVRK